MPNPFEEGVQTGRRLSKDPAFASGVLYGWLAEDHGVRDPASQPGPTEALAVADALHAAGVPPPPPPPGRAVSPSQRAVLAALQGLQHASLEAPYIVRDIHDALHNAGRPMSKETLRETLRRMVGSRRLTRLPTVDRRTGRPAWGYAGP